MKRAERKEQRGRRGWRRRRRKGTAILRGKEQDTDSLSTQYRESFSHASGLSSTMAVGGDGGGWWKREGVDLSCQTLAPRGGAPSLPRPPARTPRCPIEIAGFGVVSLCSPPSLLPFSPFRSLSPRLTHSLAHSLSLSFSSNVPRPFTRLSSRQAPCPPPRTAGGVTLRPCTFSHSLPPGKALETEFRNLHICRPRCSLARASQGLTF